LCNSYSNGELGHIPYLNLQQVQKVGICYSGCNTALLLPDRVCSNYGTSGFELKTEIGILHYENLFVTK
jgi:hypothetical protein